MRLFLNRNMKEGVNPKSVAYDLVGRINRKTGLREGGIIGLTEKQTEFSDDLREALIEGDPKRLRAYLRYKHRDDTFDELVEAALKNKRGLSRKTASKLVGRYNNNVLLERGNTIARTELIGGMNWAQYEGLRQMVDKGQVAAEDIELEWDAAGDKATRDSHRAMDGQKRTFGQAFKTGDGFLLLHPHDRSLNAPAEEIIKCRCALRVRINHRKAKK